MRRTLLIAMLAFAVTFGGLSLYGQLQRAVANQPLVADLSDHLVGITTGFSGASVLLFGAVDGKGDVAVVVRGPARNLVMHRKSRVLGVWANTHSMTFRGAPGYYAVAASGPLDEIARDRVLARNEIGVDNLKLKLPLNLASPGVAKVWRDALVRNQEEQGLYRTEVQPVSFLGARLFRARLELPANVPTGTYQVQVYLLKNGRIESAQTTPLIVSRIGIEAEIFNFAHNHAAYYGLIAIVVALVAGWLGNAAFKKS
ncbi:MAG: TIGR02186 family protein [Pseudomonadota bacterium]